METLRTAVIGTGQMGQHHVRIYSEFPYSDLVGISDIDLKVVDNLAKKYNTKSYSDYREMIEREKPDAVSIAVPTHMHEKIASEILKDTSVLVEKPISDTEDGALSIINAARKSGNTLMVGQIERFNPVIQYFRSWV